jgi:hypothetical protein
MMLSSNSFRLVLMVAAAFSAVTTATDVVDLGEAGEYVILAKTGISTVPNSVITGNVGVSPIAASAMTGFGLTMDAGGKYSTSAQLTGEAYAASHTAPTPTHLTLAVSNMEAAYTDAAGRIAVDSEKLNLGAGLLGGVGFGDATVPLTTGVYTFGTGVTITSDIYFEGDANSVFIIRTTGNLLQVADTKVVLLNGVTADNIFWQVAGNVKVFEGAQLEGILLVKLDALFMTGSSLNGRVLAQTACNLQIATITKPV